MKDCCYRVVEIKIYETEKSSWMAEEEEEEEEEEDEEEKKKKKKKKKSWFHGIKPHSHCCSI